MVKGEQLLALLKASQSRRRFRTQSGSVVKRSDAFYIRYYKDSDGGMRVKVTEWLCDLSVMDPQKRKLLAKSHLSAVNNLHHAALRSEAPSPVLTVGAFWSKTYRPWVEKNKRASTLRGYDYVWKLYVRAELETRPIDAYHTIDASEFLTGLTSKLNSNSLHHVRALMSGIFAHAVNTKGANGKALIDRNPIRDVKVLANVRESKERVAYTLEETVAIINAIERTDAKLFFALCAVLGMRPSEAAAVKWENVNDGVLQVRAAAPYGVLGPLKTKKSKRDLDLIEPVASLLKSHRENSGAPGEGLLFTADGTRPIDHNGFAKYYIKPFAKEVCKRWNGCYSGRHGAATTLYNQEGDVRAAYQVLGNSLEVVMKTYVHADVEQGRTALAKHEQRYLKAMQKGKE